MGQFSSTSGVTGAIKRAANHSKLNKSYSAAQLRSILAEMKLRLMEGDDDETIQELLGLTVARYNDLKKELYRREQATLAQKTTEDVYLEYKWSQEKCIADLDAALAGIPENQPNAAIGAIRAKSEIRDKILKVGQDTGLIAKTPERKLIIHGHVVAQMSDKELRKTIAQETQALGMAIAKYGDTDMDGNPIAMDGEPQFTLQEKTGMNLSGPTKADAARKSRVAVKRSKVIDVDPG